MAESTVLVVDDEPLIHELGSTTGEERLACPCCACQSGVQTETTRRQLSARRPTVLMAAGRGWRRPQTLL